MGVTADVLSSAHWRLVGPFRGGRVVAVAADPVEPLTFYFGACSGGVWKTEDAGRSWQNVSDGYVKTAAVGALAVAPSDRNVIYAGMGEACIRGNVSHGDGVYRSDDAGQTWRHLGLADTRHIGRIRVHPRNPDLVYVAAFGHAWGPNQERGVFRSKDGGQSWEKILYRDEKTGAIDLTLDPGNPRLMYASLWEAQRYPWSLVSGGNGSGIFKSTDGGDSWTEITRNRGLPEGLMGRIGVAISPAKPERVWALIESEKGGLYRSDDGGQSWELVNDNPDLRQRPWYYMHVFADPQDENVVWVLNLRMWKSTDGGRSMTQIPTPHGDNHDLVIDPTNTDRLVMGDDGGASVSLDGGVTWSTIYNQPTAQFYHVITDTQFPYRIYGAQQDNSTLSVPSYSDRGAIVDADTYPVGGGESGYIAVRPDNPNIVFAGSYASRMTRYNHASANEVDITVWPEDPIGYGAESLRYRFQWTFPIILSPHDPDLLYAAGNHVFSSRDGGQSWQELSPDLTRGEPETLKPSGGPITKDNVSTEYYGTVFALAESPLQAGVIWAGSDDGLVHVTRDGGKSWSNITPPRTLLGEFALISIVEASPHDAATAYVAATRYKLDDPRPYLLKTSDYGQSWTAITSGIPQDDFTRTIREDPKRKGLLYAGSETGVYVSYDDGAGWQPITGNLPVVPIHDLTVHDDALILATHGRSFWAIDDLAPIRDAPQAGTGGKKAEVFPMSTVWRIHGPHRFPTPTTVGYKVYLQAGGGAALGVVVQEPDGQKQVKLLDAGENPPHGAAVTYRLTEPAEEVKLTFLDAGGKEIRTYSSKDEEGAGKWLKTDAGIHRFVWDLRYPEGKKLENTFLSAYWGGSTIGPVAPPGSYQVRLDANGESATHSATQHFELREDPRVQASQQDLEAQFQLLLDIRDKLTEVHEAVERSRTLRREVGDWQARLEAQGQTELAQEAKKVADWLLEAENELVESRSKGAADSFNYPPKVNSKLASLQSTVAYGDSRPPQQTYDTYRQLGREADQGIANLKEVLEAEVGNLNRKIAEAGIPAIG